MPESGGGYPSAAGRRRDLSRRVILDQNRMAGE